MGVMETFSSPWPEGLQTDCSNERNVFAYSESSWQYELYHSKASGQTKPNTLTTQSSGSVQAMVSQDMSLHSQHHPCLSTLILWLVGMLTIVPCSTGAISISLHRPDKFSPERLCHITSMLCPRCFLLCVRSPVGLESVLEWFFWALRCHSWADNQMLFTLTVYLLIF